MNTFVRVDHRGLTWDNFVSQFISRNPDASGRLPIGLQENLWSLWVECLLTLDDYDTGSLPTPQGFKNWRDWVDATVQVLN